MTIAVDFDGTIVEHRYPQIGEEIPFAVETLKMLVQDHHKVILWSVREGELLFIPRGMKYYMEYEAPENSFVLINFDTIKENGDPTIIFDGFRSLWIIPAS